LEFFLLQNLSTHGAQLNFEGGGDPKGITINGVGDPSKLLHPLRGGVFIGILKNVQMCIKKKRARSNGQIILQNPSKFKLDLRLW
jgi:hypothetical protein